MINQQNNVQSLDKKRGPGRPKSIMLDWARKNSGSKITSRQSLYNLLDRSTVGTLGCDLGLLDSDFRDNATGKRMLTKLSVIGRLFGSKFFDTEEGKSWLMDNWRALVEMTTGQVIEWAKRQHAQPNAA